MTTDGGVIDKVDNGTATVLQRFLIRGVRLQRTPVDSKSFIEPIYPTSDVTSIIVEAFGVVAFGIALKADR